MACCKLLLEEENTEQLVSVESSYFKTVKLYVMIFTQLKVIMIIS